MQSGLVESRIEDISPRFNASDAGFRSSSMMSAGSAVKVPP